MKRRTLILIIASLLVYMFALCAFAYVAARPDSKNAARTGPGAGYVKLAALPKDAVARAIEVEEIGSEKWAFIEWQYEGEVVRGYTEISRIDEYGFIPRANPANSKQNIVRSGSVWTAPYSHASYRGRVDMGQEVTLLRYENGYAYIEFYDYENKGSSRGYVDADMIGSAPASGSILIPVEPSVSVIPIITAEPVRGTSATPNQKLAFRTGPNTSYPDLFTLPQSTEIIAYEYEEGNGVTWVLVEFEFEGRPCRGYTGLKRMQVHGDIPWANHLYEPAWVNYDCNVLSAPAHNAGYRGYIDAGEQVTVLCYESGYAHIEFYDNAARMYSRGYVPINAVS